LEPILLPPPSFFPRLASSLSPLKAMGLGWAQLHYASHIVSPSTLHSLRQGFPTVRRAGTHKDNGLLGYCHKFAIFADSGPLLPICVLLHVDESMRTLRKDSSHGTLPPVN
jgi:hypothetical protein